MCAHMCVCKALFLDPFAVCVYVFLAHQSGVSNRSFASVSNRPQQKNIPFVHPVWFRPICPPSKPINTSKAQPELRWTHRSSPSCDRENRSTCSWVSLTPHFSRHSSIFYWCRGSSYYVLITGPCTAKRNREQILSASWVVQCWNTFAGDQEPVFHIFL